MYPQKNEKNTHNSKIGKSVFFQMCPCLRRQKETLVLIVILIKKEIKPGSFAVRQPCSKTS